MTRATTLLLRNSSYVSSCRIPLLLLTFLLLLTTPTIKAQDLHIGLITGVSADARHLGGGTDLAPSGWSIGLASLFQPVYPFGIRGDLVYSSIQERFLFSSSAGSDTARLSFNILSIPLNLRVDLSDDGLVPYVYAGTTIGVVLKVIDEDARATVDNAVADEHYNTFSANADLGGGIQGEIAENLSLSLDLRGSWILKGMSPRNLEEWTFDRIGLVGSLYYQLF